MGTDPQVREPDPSPSVAAPHRLILVRHGQTPHTAAGLISGSGFRPEPRLDQDGYRQALGAAERLTMRAERIDQLLASPLLRTRQTAELIAEQVGLEPASPARAWAESNFGAWEGMSVEDVVRRFPGGWEGLIADAEAAPPGGESLSQVRHRVLEAWRDLENPGRTSVVVTHLTPIRIVVAECLGTPLEAFGRIMAAPGSITVVDRWADGGVAVLTVGEGPYLRPQAQW